jgi:hypothetical protein
MFLPIAFIAVVIAACVFAVSRGRAKKRATQSDRADLLQQLAPVVSGTVSDGPRLTGTYGGRDVTVTLERVDPIPVSATRNAGMGNNQVDIVRLHVSGDGRAFWHLRPGLGKPFGTNHFEFVHHDGGGSLLQKFTGLNALQPDPELEDRLRDAGIMQAAERLEAPAGWFPQVLLSPNLAGAMAERMRAAGVNAPANAQPSPSARGGLEIQLQRDGERDPTPDRFRDLLEAALAILEINARVNAPAS